jgi:hypothetical protein
MRGNGLKGDTIRPGHVLFIPDDTSAFGENGKLGQHALNLGNARKAEKQAYYDAEAKRINLERNIHSDPEFWKFYEKHPEFAPVEKYVPSGVFSQKIDLPSRNFAADYDNIVLDTWSDFKTRTREGLDNYALSGGGNYETAVGSVVYAASEIGYAMIDLGLGFGKLGTHVMDSANRGSVSEDLATYVVDPLMVHAKTLHDADTYRVSAGIKVGDNYDVKGMIGTDRAGFQVKQANLTDEVLRTTYNWKEQKWQSEVLIEKNSPVAIKFQKGTFGLPVKVEVVPGLRQNVSGNKQLLPSVNVDFVGFEIGPYKPKVTIEFRKSSY